MSRFIANSISFTKDLNYYYVKGGESNVVPRSNSWNKNPIPIETLYDQVYGGMIEFSNNTNEKIAFIKYLVFEELPFKNESGDFENSYYKLSRRDVKPKEIIEHDNEFLKRLKDGLKKLSNKKEYSVKIKNEYILKRYKNKSFTTNEITNSQKFSKYVAKNIAIKYDGEIIFNP